MKAGSLLLALVAVMVAGTVLAAEVTSVNVVGFKRLDLPAGLTLVSAPFVQVGDQVADVTLGGAFGDDTPEGTIIYLYTPGVGYTTYTYVDGMGWVDDFFTPGQETNVLYRGEGFWVRAPSAFTNAVAGEVPSSLNPTNTVVLPSGLQLFSFGFPADTPVDQSGLNPTEGDIIYNYEGGTYTTYTYVDGMGWVDDLFSPVEVVFMMGEAYWYRAVSQITWDQTKPYTDP